MHAFEHWIVEGPPEMLRGFIRGWAASTALDPVNMDRAALWAEEWDIAMDSFRERLAELVRPGVITHLLVRSNATDSLRAALAIHGESLSIRAAAALSGAHFDFEFDLYARSEAAEVRALFETPPPEVAITWVEPPSESAAPDGQGMYAPEHAYRYHGRGTASGSVDGVLSLHIRCRQHERIRQHPVHLDTI